MIEFFKTLGLSHLLSAAIGVGSTIAFQYLVSVPDNPVEEKIEEVIKAYTGRDIDLQKLKDILDKAEKAGVKIPVGEN